jgi:hypothetical protein
MRLSVLADQPFLTTLDKSNFHLGALDNSYLPHASSLASNILVLSCCALKPHKHGIGSN